MNAAPSTMVWANAPGGKHWSCPDCEHATVWGEVAGQHAITTGHGVPTTQPNGLHVNLIPRSDIPAPTAKKQTLAVRAGDYMQAGYDLRLALEVATVAIGEAERAGAPADTINRLRAMVKTLRA